MAIAALWCAHADAQGPLPRSGADHRPRATVVAPPATGLETTSDLRAHFGLDLVERLLRSQDPEDRLRGIERAASLGTPEAMARLIDAADPSGPGRTDTRALLEIVRGLAAFDRPAARAALVTLVNAPNIAGSDRFSNRASSARVED
ncbi:MAG TPA: hypothetical protein VNO21_19235, partial [Polyangiaceae bacterium]|nr:hypothetical protein [Polyangiaceae bacterium]